MNRVKAKSGLLRSPYLMQPVNATARQVAGAAPSDRKKRLREEVRRAQRAAQSAQTPEAKESALSAVADLRRQLKGTADPDTGPKAVRKAQSALERAKWMRSNSRA